MEKAVPTCCTQMMNAATAQALLTPSTGPLQPLRSMASRMNQGLRLESTTVHRLDVQRHSRIKDGILGA